MSVDSDKSDSRPPRPTPIEVDYSGIPGGLKSRESWLLWKYKFDHDRDEWTKVPVNPHTGGFGSSTDPDSWAAFDKVREIHERDGIQSDGIGFVFDPSDTIVGVDIDDARNPENGRPSPNAKAIINELDSWTEVSPSGTGYHVYLHGMLPADAKNRDGKIEIYQDKRFFTVTGNHVDGTPESIERRNDSLQSVHAEYVADDESDEQRPQGGSDGPSESVVLSDRELLEKAKNADDGGKFKRLWNGDTSGYPSHSEARKALVSKLAFWTGNDRKRTRKLFRQSPLAQQKPEDSLRDFDDYLESKVFPKSETYNPKGSANETTDPEPDTGDSGLIELFRHACRQYHINPSAVATRTENGETVTVGISSVVNTESVGDAIITFNKNATLLDGTDKQSVVADVVVGDLKRRGQFFKTEAGRLYYFDEPKTELYRVDDPGRRTFATEFQDMVWNRYNLQAGRFSRNLGKDILSKSRHSAPTREVFRFACYDEFNQELYVSDFENGYYAVSQDSIEWRPNGTDVFFLSDDYAESYTYLESDERPELPDELPGERPRWLGQGDPIMRMFGNRVNFDDRAALTPLQQRQQLYTHLHTLPFIDLLNARPIMAWVGEKGSGKTVIERSIGKFIYGDDYRESVMPDNKDDFLAKVSNQSLAFLDNYDDGEDWANDVLAAVATGAGLDQRELYTTNTLHREVPRCWLSLTSRDPPFRRDDVADRTLVFRVKRVEDGFVGMGSYLNQVTDYRDLLWSTYLDNLQTVLSEYLTRDIDSMSSSHRMADWAIFAKIVADSLDVAGIDDLLETMETERATFALENEDWANVIGKWVRSDPDDAQKWRSAGEIGDVLERVAGNNDMSISVTHAAGIGSKFSMYRNELAEIYNLEIDDSGRSNRYRFNVSSDTEPAGLGRFH